MLAVTDTLTLRGRVESWFLIIVSAYSIMFFFNVAWKERWYLGTITIKNCFKVQFLIELKEKLL